MTDFKSRTLRGFSWSLAGQAGRYGTLIAVNVILARLLSPREFGEVAMVMVATGFAAILAEMGWGGAVIQSREKTDKKLSSVFWTNIVTALCVAGFLTLCAPWIARYNREPALSAIVAALSWILLIDSVSIVQKALLKRNLDFRRLAYIEILSAMLAGPLAVVLALRGYGVWSLVGYLLATSAAASVLTWFFSDWRPRAVFKRTDLRELFPFSGNLAMDNVLNYSTQNLDNLLIGIALGAAALGIYSKAYLVMTIPMIAVSWIPSRVIFPAFSSIRKDPPRIKSAYIRVSQAVALLTFPMMLGLLVTVPEFVHVAFGRQWMGMVPVLRLLASAGMVRSVLTLVGSLYLSQGRADLQLRIGLFVKGMHVLGIIIGLRWGIVGVAAGLAVTSMLAAYPHIRSAGGLVGLSWVEYLKSLGGVFACAALMAAAVMVLGAFLPDDWGNLHRLAVKALAGIVCYAGLLSCMNVGAWEAVRELVSPRLRS